MNPGAARVVQTDDRTPCLHREIHDLDDFLAENLAEGSAEDGEVLREDTYGPAVDRAVAGQYPIAEGTILLLPEVVGAVPGQSVYLLVGTLVEKRLDPLKSGHLALGVLLVDRCLTLVGGVGAARLENLRLSSGGSALGAGWFSDLAWLCAHSPFLHRFVVPDH